MGGVVQGVLQDYFAYPQNWALINITGEDGSAPNFFTIGRVHLILIIVLQEVLPGAHSILLQSPDYNQLTILARSTALIGLLIGYKTFIQSGGRVSGGNFWRIGKLFLNRNKCFGLCH